MEVNGIIGQNSIQNLRVNESTATQQNVNETSRQESGIREARSDTLEITSQSNSISTDRAIETESRAREVQDDLTRAITENPNSSVLAQSGNLSAERVANLL